MTRHYTENKESARKLILERLEYFNKHYNLKWNRVAIRNQRRCWGSCTSLKNLNFNYKIQFLPPHLRDYIVVHELCHLVELNHKQPFWSLVGQVMPEYKTYVAELRTIDKGGNSIPYLLKIQEAYLAGVKEAILPLQGIQMNTSEWCKVCGKETVCNCESVLKMGVAKNTNVK